MRSGIVILGEKLQLGSNHVSTHVNTMLLHIDQSMINHQFWIHSSGKLSIVLNHLKTLDFPPIFPQLAHPGFSGRTEYHRDASNNLSRNLRYHGCYTDIAVSSKKSPRTSSETHTHTHAHIPQLTCQTTSHLHQIGCLSAEVEKNETQTKKKLMASPI